MPYDESNDKKIEVGNRSQKGGVVSKIDLFNIA